ncbi:MAG: response regulator, partial [Roseiflexaceae bacterium]
AGMDTYLAKPLQMSELHTALAVYHSSVTTLATPAGPHTHADAAPLTTIGVSATRALDPPTLERLHSIFGPQRARMDALIEHYCADTSAFPAKMYQAAAENDIDTLRLSLHQLKSSSAIVAAIRLANVCKQFEAVLETNNQADWQTWIQQIEAEILHAQAALKLELSS